jgi:photosystem II stability/assembly factor-like uncharacterized protein
MSGGRLAGHPAARVLVATGERVLRVDPETGAVERVGGLNGRRPTCLATERGGGGRAWCGTLGGGVFRSDDGGASWLAAGLAGERITAIAVGPTATDPVWVGTEPSAVWRSGDSGRTWERLEGLEALPSSGEWAFPPRPETHHVRWIACHPGDPRRLWVAIEAGALVATRDGGRSWEDRVPGGPYDTHELAVHPAAAETLRVAAGDGYYESHDGGGTWSSPEAGLDVGYLRSVAIDPGDPATVVVSAASAPRRAYVAGQSDGRLYRRSGAGGWARVTVGWPDPPSTIAPLLVAGGPAGEIWAADERGLHRSGDGGTTWAAIARFDPAPGNLRGLAVLDLER